MVVVEFVATNASLVSLVLVVNLILTTVYDQGDPSIGTKVFFLSCCLSGI